MHPIVRTAVAVSVGVATVLVASAHAEQQKKSRYSEGAVTDGGTISGIVRFEGDVPQREVVDVTTKEAICHAEPIHSEKLVVSSEGGLQWAVVSIKGIKAGKPFPAESEPPVLDQQGCVFTPHVLVAPIGKPITLLNSDGVLHNVHTWPKKNRSKNIAMPGSVKKMSMKLRRPERIRVTCDVHPWMEAWIIATNHPYNAVSDENGAFELTEVPPGTYTLELWHETLGKLKQSVTVEPGKTAQVEFSLSMDSATTK